MTGCQLIREAGVGDIVKGSLVNQTTPFPSAGEGSGLVHETTLYYVPHPGLSYQLTTCHIYVAVTLVSVPVALSLWLSFLLCDLDCCVSEARWASLFFEHAYCISFRQPRGTRKRERLPMRPLEYIVHLCAIHIAARGCQCGL